MRHLPWAKPLLFGTIVALGVHVLAINALPTAIMSIALNRLSQQAGGWNKLYHSPRVTAQSQRIVRSSPDLAYSICALDLRDGPVSIHVHRGDDYVSAAIYADNTDNVFSINDQQMTGPQARLLITSKGMNTRPAPNEQVVTIPSHKGLLLVRRLAPDATSYARADAVRQADTCAHARLDP